MTSSRPSPSCRLLVAASLVVASASASATATTTVDNGGSGGSGSTLSLGMTRRFLVKDNVRGEDYEDSFLNVCDERTDEIFDDGALAAPMGALYDVFASECEASRQNNISSDEDEDDEEEEYYYDDEEDEDEDGDGDRTRQRKLQEEEEEDDDDEEDAICEAAISSVVDTFYTYDADDDNYGAYVEACLGSSTAATICKVNAAAMIDGETQEISTGLPVCVPQECDVTKEEFLESILPAVLCTGDEDETCYVDVSSIDCDGEEARVVDTSSGMSCEEALDELYESNEDLSDADDDLEREMDLACLASIYPGGDIPEEYVDDLEDFQDMDTEASCELQSEPSVVEISGDFARLEDTDKYNDYLAACGNAAGDVCTISFYVEFQYMDDELLQRMKLDMVDFPMCLSNDCSAPEGKDVMMDFALDQVEAFVGLNQDRRRNVRKTRRNLLEAVRGHRRRLQGVGEAAERPESIIEMNEELVAEDLLDAEGDDSIDIRDICLSFDDDEPEYKEYPEFDCRIAAYTDCSVGEETNIRRKVL